MKTTAIALSVFACAALAACVGDNPCTAGDEYHDGRCYRLVETPTSALDAVGACEESGGALASIRSRGDHVFLLSIVPDSAWIGTADDVWARALDGELCEYLQADGKVRLSTCWAAPAYPAAYVCEYEVSP